MKNTPIKVATIDLYNNEKNEGMRCIKEIVTSLNNGEQSHKIDYKVFDTRFKGEVPDLDQDIYISSGGPGSPFEDEGTKWEKDYFNLLDKIWDFNQNNSEKKKYLFFICHSFQLMGRFFKLGLVIKRPSKSFGVMPFSITEEGKPDILLNNLSNPFYAADIRQFQVIEPDKNVFKELGAKILSYEIPDDGIKEPALAAIRISDEIVGTQFHPEADPESMLYHIKQDERKKQVVEKYGEERYDQMIELLKRSDTIKLTRESVLPSFLRNAINELSSVYS